MVEEEADALSDALPSERVLVTQPLLDLRDFNSPCFDGFPRVMFQPDISSNGLQLAASVRDRVIVTNLVTSSSPIDNGPTRSEKHDYGERGRLDDRWQLVGWVVVGGRHGPLHDVIMREMNAEPR
jgi:hypothetical protein